MTDVVVVGGGFAGMAAACRLAGDGAKVHVVERAPRLGGRAASFRDPESGENVDYGEHILMRCCTAASGFLRRIGAESAVRFQESLSIPILHDGARSVLRSAPLPGPLHLAPGLLGYRPLSLSERLAALVAGLALLGEREADETFADWLARHGQRERAIHRLWNPIVIAALNAPADVVGVRAARKVFRDGFFLRHGADVGLFEAPLGTVFEAAARYVADRQGTVELRAGAVRIVVADGRAVGVDLVDGRRIDADAVIAAVPPVELRRLVGELSATSETLHKSEALEWAPIVNIHLWFDRSVTDDAFSVAVDSPIQAIFDLTRLGGRPAAGRHHLVLSQSAAWEWIGRPAGDVVAGLLAALAELRPAVREARLIRHLVVRHPNATFVSTPGSDALRPGAVTPVVDLYLAGDWTETGWPSTIESAVRSGVSAAAHAEAVLTL